jgi:hypothetical protein
MRVQAWSFKKGNIPSAFTLGFKDHLKWGTPQHKIGKLTAAQ